VLRFWESRFTQIRPLKRGGGRRYYRPDDVDLLRGVRHLLYGEGYTIRGVQRILREQGLSFVQSVWRTEVPAADFDDEDEAAREDLEGKDDAEDVGEFEDEAEQEGDGDEEAEGGVSSRPREPSFFEGPPTTAARADERREPSLIPQSSLLPPAAAPVRLSVDSQSRQKLEAALGELVACRGLIHAVLTDAPERTDEPG
jgi:DNA-binding transcriptional MerR regulator